MVEVVHSKKQIRWKRVSLWLFLTAVLLVIAHGIWQSHQNRKLILSIKKHNVDGALAALKWGADPNIRYHAEDFYSSEDLVQQGAKRLFQGKPAFDPGDPPVLMIVLDHGPDYRLDYRLHKRTRYEATVLIKALSDSKQQVFVLAKALLDHGADPNARALDSSPLDEAALYDETAVVELLLQYGASVTARGRADDTTPLMMVARYGHTELAARLLAAGADPSAADKSGVTVLMNAVRSGRACTVQALLTYHVNVNAQDANKQTALSMAKRFHFDHIAALLQSNGAMK